MLSVGVCCLRDNGVNSLASGLQGKQNQNQETI
jgi:hypothetical protein